MVMNMNENKYDFSMHDQRSMDDLLKDLYDAENSIKEFQYEIGKMKILINRAHSITYDISAIIKYRHKMGRME